MLDVQQEVALKSTLFLGTELGRAWERLDQLLTPVVELKNVTLDGEDRFKAMELVRQLVLTEVGGAGRLVSDRFVVGRWVYTYAKSLKSTLDAHVQNGACAALVECANRTLARVFHHLNVLICTPLPEQYESPF